MTKTRRSRKSSVVTQAVVTNPAPVTDGVTEVVSRQESVTDVVSGQEMVTTQEAVSESSLSAHEPGTHDVTAEPEPVTGQEVVTDVVTGPAEPASAPEPVTKPVTEPVTNGLLRKLVSELLAAPAEQVEQLRRILASPPAVRLPEKRRVPRRTYAWYLPEELGEAIKAKAKAEGVPPSEVAERLLWQAKTAGWL